MKYKAYNEGRERRHSHFMGKCLGKHLDDAEEYGVIKHGQRLVNEYWKKFYDSWDGPYSRPNRRCWKAHCKCRHQWERHEAPAIESKWCWDPDGSKGEHLRKWVMDCLKKKGVCIFNVHHDAGLEDFLERCENWDIRYLGHGLMEVTLLIQDAGKPKHKESPGEKRQSGKSRRHARRRERMKRRKASILAAKERARLASRKGGKGVSRPRVPYVCKSRVRHFVGKNGTGVYRPSMKCNAQGETLEYWTSYDAIYAAALEDHIKGIVRKNSSASNLLRNYSSYKPMAKSRCVLGEFDHDYKQFHTALEQCCVWLTGRRVCEYPAWGLSMLTSNRLPDVVSKRIWDWMLGVTYVRDVYGLSKNEAREIIRLPASINDENEAIVAAIAAARHCDETLSKNLIRQIPVFGGLVNDPTRCDFVRRLVEWLIAVRANPIAGKLHDILDFFFRSGVWRDAEFSFKGRTLRRVEQLMREWHQDNIQHGGVSMKELMEKWAKHDFDCEVKYYQFQELLSAKELLDEGKRQHNCVFSYRSLCRSGVSSIVSMRGGANLTLEIRERRIVQIRGVCNRLPYPEEMRVIRQYASLKNLTIA